MTVNQVVRFAVRDLTARRSRAKGAGRAEHMHTFEETGFTAAVFSEEYIVSGQWPEGGTAEIAETVNV